MKILTTLALSSTIMGSIAPNIIRKAPQDNFEETKTKITHGNFKYVSINKAWENRVIYQVMPASFRDSNNDNIGDLKGIQNAIPYLKKVGINALWITPVFLSSAYHHYDAIDFKKIDPTLGTMKDFVNLTKALKKNDIKIILDMSFNHTSPKNSWFKKALEYSKNWDDNNPNKKYKNYYKIERYRNKPEMNDHEKWLPLSKFDPNAHGYYYSFFGGKMPDLNLNNQDVRNELLDIEKFWLTKGVDGFRIDASLQGYGKNEYDYNNSFSRVTKNQEIWGWLAENIINFANDPSKDSNSEYNKMIPKHDLYISYENAVPDSAVLKEYVNLGSELDFSFSSKIRQVIRTSDNGFHERPLSSYANDMNYFKKPQLFAIDAKSEDYTKPIPIDNDSQANGKSIFFAGNPDYIDTPFIGNHDQERIADITSVSKQKLAAAMELMMPNSVPIIYYGDELGLSKNDFTVPKAYGDFFIRQRGPMEWQNSNYTPNYIGYALKDYEKKNPNFNYHSQLSEAHGTKTQLKYYEDNKKNASESYNVAYGGNEDRNSILGTYINLLKNRKKFNFIRHAQAMYSYDDVQNGISMMKTVTDNSEYYFISNTTSKKIMQPIQNFEEVPFGRKYSSNNAGMAMDSYISRAGSEQYKVYKVLGSGGIVLKDKDDLIVTLKYTTKKAWIDPHSMIIIKKAK